MSGEERLRRVVGPLFLILCLGSAYWIAPDFGPYDFHTYHTAGVLLEEGSSSDAIYNVSFLRNAHKRIHDRAGLGPYFYSPVTLPAARILAFADSAESAVRMYRVAIFVILGLVLAGLGVQSGSWLWPALLALSYPVQCQFTYNNATPVLTGLIALFIVGIRAERWFLAGLSLALAMTIKPYVVLFLLPLFLARMFRPILWTLGASSGAVLVSFAWSTPSAWMAWADQLITRGAMGIYAIYNNLSVPALIVRPFSPRVLWVKPIAFGDFPGLPFMLLAALPALVLVLLLRRKSLREPGFGEVMIYLLLLSPFTWDHVYLFLLLVPLLYPRLLKTTALLIVPTLFYYPVLQILLSRESWTVGLFLLLLYFPLVSIILGWKMKAESQDIQ
ncbi:MAG TPA: glycosyltransferase family 87 protein [Thermoanaerobaculia bacterium]|nr:glycosyltransferase family 87 protein [Thermoanaerobaculia bacterium]HUM30776.1 glycosyltransferase family 87 protein [Thermoanaerobaculia bacterium]HXK69024.1 glycosyltransferase family 87 protein [Thermoanaerobaculia bacterium]